MAEAHLADRFDAPDESFVLKRIRPDHAGSKEFEQRFVFEAQVASRVVQRNLVRFREFGKVGDCFYLAMDQVRGRSLHRIFESIFKQGRIPPVPVAGHLATGMLAGLAALHRVTDEQGQPRPILHRDVTPKNVIVDPEGEAVLIDFGIAKDIYGPSITAPGQLIGTARYMAPEHRRAEFLDTRADVFSVSVILFELFSGTHPWPPVKSVRELLRTVFDPPEITAPVRERVPEPVLQVLLRGLECEAEHRFPDAAAMAHAMARTHVPDQGPQAVAEWVQSLDLPPDEALSRPAIDQAPEVNDVPSEIRVFWTSSGFLSSDSQPAPETSHAQVLAVPPLPPRRDAALGGDQTEDLVRHLAEMRRMRAWVIGGIVAILACAGTFVWLGGG